MATKHSTTKLGLYSVVLALLFLGLLQIALQARGMVFALEALGTLFLAGLVCFGFIGYKEGWGEHLFFAAFLLFLGNLLLLRYATGSFYGILFALSFLGFGLSLPRKKSLKKKCSSEAAEPHSVVFDAPKESKSQKESKKKEAAEESSTKDAKESEKHEGSSKSVTFHPGKYVASTRGNVYHEAKCDWAKKVSKTHRVWFNSKKEAEDKGYQAHGCVH